MIAVGRSVQMPYFLLQDIKLPHVEPLYFVVMASALYGWSPYVIRQLMVLKVFAGPGDSALPADYACLPVPNACGSRREFRSIQFEGKEIGYGKS